MSMKKFRIDYENSYFLKTSESGARANRLNWRCEVLLTRNEQAIRNMKVLDLASHDGRFSYACLKLGAKHVLGIEARPHLVEHAEGNLLKLGYGSTNFKFIQSDIFDQLPKFKVSEFDTVLCFGFFYHTIRQVELLRQISRLNPKYFILDSYIIRMPRGRNVFTRLLNAIVRVRPRHFTQCNVRIRKAIKWAIEEKGYLQFQREDHTKEGLTADIIDLAATPTKSLIEMLLKAYGFKFRELVWKKETFKNWSYLEDYKRGSRVSYISETT